jgi:hypothetical protein
MLHHIPLVICMIMMIISFTESMIAKYPTTIKSVVSKMTQATQKALSSRKSRMEIELPPGVDFGVELGDKKKKNSMSDTEKVLVSNREAARLFTEMFSSIQSTTTVLFPTENAAFEARNLWSASFRGQVVSVDTPGSKGYGKLRSRKFSLAEQEQALMAGNEIYIPDKTEVLIIPGPRIRDIKKLQKLSVKLGNDVLMLLINVQADVSLERGDLKQEGMYIYICDNDPSYI